MSSGKYKIPNNILIKKPSGTTVKCIKNNYYVYEHLRITDPITGKRKNASGKYLGKITLEDGFVPVTNKIKDDDINIVDCGQYIIAINNSIDVYESLKNFFNIEDAKIIYCMAIIYFVHGYVSIRDFQHYYECSILQLKFKNLPLSEESVRKYFKIAGRRTTRFEKFEQSLISNGSGYYAIDGHVILSCSTENDMAAYGNKYNKIGNTQQNFMCVFDVELNRPVTCKPFDGGTLDKTAVEDVFKTYKFKNTIFIIDAGFYSEKNIKLFSADGNKYVIPLTANSKSFKEMINDLNFDDDFVYKKGKGKKTHASLISYKEKKIENNKKIIMFRDEEMNNKLKAEYKSLIGVDDEHTNEEYLQIKDKFGIIILETNIESSCEIIYCTYKKRWKIETYYNHVKNQEEFKATYNRDYYVLQIECFIMLVEGLIYSSFMDVLQKSDNKILKGKSLNECISIAAHLKLSKHADNTWHKNEIRNSVTNLLEALNVDLDKITNIDK